MHKLSALLCVLTLAFLSVFAQADLKIIDSTADFNKTLQEAQVPVIVQFSAYWCGPCQRLKEKLVRIAPEFNDDQVLLCYVDAYVNTELKTYLKGGYPTTRTFSKGKVQEPNFVGDKPEQFVRDFIKGVIANLSESETEMSLAAVESTEGRPDPPKNPAKGAEVTGVDNFGKAITKPHVVIVQLGSPNKKYSVKLWDKFTMLAPQYESASVGFVYLNIDKPENKGLKSYLMGIVPTVRVFHKGLLKNDYFVVDKLPDGVTDEMATKEVKLFIDKMIKFYPPAAKKPAPAQMMAQSEVEAEQANTLVELKSIEEFNEAIQNNSVPAVVQFSAYWCGPCQRLKAKLVKIAPEYSVDKVRLYYVDAYVLSDLKKYLQGGYPTTRVFVNGEATKSSMVGDQSETEVRRFLNQIVKDEVFSAIE